MEFCVDAGSRSLSDDGLQHSVNNVDTIMKHNVLRKSSSCNPVRFISKEENFYNKVFVNSFTLNEVNYIILRWKYFYLLFNLLIHFFFVNRII